MTGNDDLEKVAVAFDRDTDPLKAYEEQFHQIDVDPLDAYMERVKLPAGATESTRKNYRFAYEHWREHMQNSGRHFACPNDTHVKQFMEYLSEEQNNSVSTIKKKVRNVNRAYEWWQEHHTFPHPKDYNPFRIALRETHLGDDSVDARHPRLTLEDIRSVIRDCTNIRERLFLVLQLKLGLRVGELLNIQLEDIGLSHSGIEQWYPEIGTAEPVQKYQDAIYIPSKYERDGNKSLRPRILPLDDETKQVLVQYLPTRPTVEQPWLILSQRTFGKLSQGEYVNIVWKEHFSEYNESDQHRDITSHYGRHFFSTYWRVHQDLPRELVQYMRGDKLGLPGSGEAIDEYLSAYYDDIRDEYLNHIFKLL